jgi:hypothetical protein
MAGYWSNPAPRIFAPRLRKLPRKFVAMQHLCGNIAVRSPIVPLGVNIPARIGY